MRLSVLGVDVGGVIILSPWELLLQQAPQLRQLVCDMLGPFSQVRDFNYHSMLSGRRTGVVKAKEAKGLVPLFAKGDAAADVVAQLQSGVLGWVKKCASGWCRFTSQGATGQSFDGYIAQERLWGVYPKEQVE